MYGARVSFAYAGGANNGTVTTRAVTDQVLGRADTWSYAYGSAIWHKVKIDGESVQVGYASVTETQPVGLSSPGTTSSIYHEFLNDDETSAASLALTVGKLGKESLQRAVVNGVTQQEIVRTWTDSTTGVLNGAGITYLTKEEERTYDASGLNPQLRITRIYYDTDHQSTNTRVGAQFGLATRILEYSGAETAANSYRTTERRYYGREEVGAADPANDRYIVNKLAQEILWDNRNQGNVCQRQTRYIYDTARDAGSPSLYTLPPTKGLLQEVWQAGDQSATCNAGWLKQAAYDHDGWGNVTWQKTPNGTITTTSYDRDAAAGYTVPVYPFSQTVTPQNVGETALTTTFRYYGLYGAEAGGSGRTGQLQESIDPNLAITRYSYDEFGRPKEVREPGAPFTAPASESITYSDTPYDAFGLKDPSLYPLRVKHSVRNDTAGDGNGGATYEDEWTYYNGLGQAVQTQKPGLNAGQTVVVDLNYNALGQAAVQTMPYFRNVAVGGTWSADWSKPQAEVIYDALGRITKRINPDGMEVVTQYNGRQEATLDEKYHQTSRETDAFGRVVAVRQFQGVHVAPDWNAANRYAETTYSYAVTDQLEGVDQLIDSVNKVHTSIFYDRLGYKYQMTDPGMGTWTYAYDAMGNVKRQTDARGKTVCFYYDGHNRLKGKQYRTDQNCLPATPTPAFDVSYTYDAGANAKGRRTDMTVNASGALDNKLAWTYDVRGRVDSETRTIAGLAGTYTTRYTYDSADRLRTMTYPDNEVVTTGYHGTLGLPQSLQSSLNPSASLVAVDAATGYDASNRLTAVSFPAGSPNGNTLWRIQELYLWNQRYGTGRLKSIRVETAPNLGDKLNLHDYQYDDAGNVTSVWDGSTQNTFQYDDLNQLTWAYDKSYAYDQAGRFTQFAGQTYTPDPNHPHAVRQVTVPSSMITIRPAT